MEELKKHLYSRIPFYSTLGLELLEIGNGRASFEIDACAAFSLIFPEGYITTIDLQVEFLKPVSKGKLLGKAKCLKAGKNIFFCKAKVWDEENNLISTGSSQLLRIP